MSWQSFGYIIPEVLKAINEVHVFKKMNIWRYDVKKYFPEYS